MTEKNLKNKIPCHSETLFSIYFLARQNSSAYFSRMSSPRSPPFLSSFFWSYHLLLLLLPLLLFPLLLLAIIPSSSSLISSSRNFPPLVPSRLLKKYRFRFFATEERYLKRKTWATQVRLKSAKLSASSPAMLSVFAGRGKRYTFLEPSIFKYF